MAEIVNFVMQTNRKFFESDAASTSEKERLTNWIHKTLPYVRIERIEKIRNEHLYSAFQVKKELGGGTVLELLHSTAASNIPSIKKTNLNWRLVTRSKYGVGTSFSQNADYANFHSSWSGGSSKAFVVCDVLLKNGNRVNDNNDIYPRHSDYYQSVNGHVYVKFDDFTYYPKYAIYYTKPPDEKSAFHRRSKRHRSYYDVDSSSDVDLYDLLDNFRF